jgi:hypothetical protein
MQKITLSLCFIMLTACTSMHSNDPDSLAFSIPQGSTLSLNKPLTIPQEDTHGVIQDGKEIKDSDRNDYRINCRLDFRRFGNRTIEPQDFIVSRTEDGSNWISQPAIMRYYTEIYLSSDKGTDIIKMVCQQYGDQTDRNFTVAEMQAALGDFVTFKYAISHDEKNDRANQ